MASLSEGLSGKKYGAATAEERYEIRQLVENMDAVSKSKPASKRIVRQVSLQYKGHELRSWRCNEYLYKKEPCPLPTSIRGLFTTDGEDGTVIAARGYDKFFNVGEVSRTKWPWIFGHTSGPYELTVKENGCIILASSLENGSMLLVTSKHSVNIPHSEVGTKWIQKHLASVGKKPEDFAAFLHEHNATALFELCDDDFEEHILEYPEKMRGLYLHGLNRNSKSLHTWPFAEVDKVAEEFGFNKTQYFTFDDLEEARAFTDKVRNDKALDGRAIEGFVVRCTIKDQEEPFMFKIKYDNPYLLFREWREVTKRILSEKPFKASFGLTKYYAAWVKRQLKENPEQFADYGKQKGIIAARNNFLADYKAHGGSDSEIFEEMNGQKYVLIVPVATIACGKTVTSLALSKLFGFGHIQNDNITVKKNPRGAFHKAILKEFDSHPFVIADRNNHIPLLRETLTAAIRDELPSCHIVALCWDSSNANTEEILKKTSKRVLARGEDHQSLTPERTPQFKQIMRKFMNDFRPVDPDSSEDSLIEDVIELDPMAETKDNLRKVVDELCKLFPDLVKKPTASEIDKALDYAFNYKPTVRKYVKGGKPKSEDKPAFFCLTPNNIDINGWLQEFVSAKAGEDMEVCKRLMSVGGHDREFHITLSHISDVKKPNGRERYNSYHDVVRSDDPENKVSAECTADYIVCDGNAMALRVKSMAIKGDRDLPKNIISTSTTKDGSGKSEFLSFNTIPHVTLYIGQGTKAYHSNGMLEAVFGSENSDAPQNHPNGWAVIPIALSFNAVLDKFMK